MTKLLASNNGQFLSPTSSSGSSTEHYEIVKKTRQAQIHRLEALAWKYNVSFYLLFSSDISEFENRVEEVRDELMEGLTALSKEDVNILKQLVGKLDVLRLQYLRETPNLPKTLKLHVVNLEQKSFYSPAMLPPILTVKV